MECYRKSLDAKDLAASTLAAAITAARMKAGLSEQDLAYAQGILPSEWSRQMHGRGHIALDRLAHAPLAFRVALIEELETLWGIETTMETIHRDLSAIRLEVAKVAAAAARRVA